MEAMTTSCIRDSCIQLQFVQEDLRNLILHCDIKPYNVLFYSDSLPEVADFGWLLGCLKDAVKNVVFTAYGMSVMEIVGKEEHWFW